MPYHNDFQQMRDRHANRKAAFSARAELGKLGVTIEEPTTDKPLDQLPRAEALAYRNSLRRASNALTTHAREKDENLTDGVMDALEYINNAISLISAGMDHQEQMDLTTANALGTMSEGERLRDTEGRQIGTLLTASDLQNQATIARRLNAMRPDGGGFNNGDDQVSLSDFIRGVANMRTSDGVRAALSEGTNTAGGYTVPTVLMPGILNALVPASSVLSAGANVAVLDTSASSFSIAAVDTIPTPAWRQEHGQVAESEPAFRAVKVTPQSLAFRFKISRELLADSLGGLDAALRTAIAQAFAKEIDRASLMGSGTEPEIRGLRNIPGINKLPMGTNGAPITDWRQFIRARRLITEANAPAPDVAILSPREDETMSLLVDTTGQPLRRPEALSNWKFLTTSQIPTNETVGTATNAAAIYVGGFQMFTIYMRESVSIQLLKELYAETGEVGFICHTRLDVASAYPKAFTVIEGVTDTE
ncbi:TPA: phage major capsid protein [Stenotrophomonas maltophilia]|nr:phage major capsid protein [Stenotrophomonas maltophilia]